MGDGGQSTAFRAAACGDHRRDRKERRAVGEENSHPALLVKVRDVPWEFETEDLWVSCTEAGLVGNLER